MSGRSPLSRPASRRPARSVLGARPGIILLATVYALHQSMARADGRTPYAIVPRRGDLDQVTRGCRALAAKASWGAKGRTHDLLTEVDPTTNGSVATYPRRMRVPRSVAVATAMIGVYATVVRPRLLRSGATAEEVEGPNPGSDLLPGGARGSTMAVTIDAPPRRVWPWLVQMGHGRAGWYSWDRLDNFGVPSADRIHPEWQDVSVGDRLLSTPDGKHWFEVAALEPERFLALQPSQSKPVAAARWRRTGGQESERRHAWCFLLRELPDERTRLIVTLYVSGRPRPVESLAGYLVWEPAHWVMQRRQFTNLKRRTERDTSDLQTGSRPSAVSSTS